MQKIFIVEDNEDLRLNLVDYLEARGYETDNTDDGLKAFALLLLEQYDLIVLDVMLPGMDGFRLCEELRKRGDDTPVLFLSARDTVQDRIGGLSRGADDYLVKTFSLVELDLRIQAILKRTRKSTVHSIQVADVVMDLDTCTVSRSGIPIKLGPKAFQILKVLMLRSPAVVSRNEIQAEIWGGDPPDSDSLRTHIHALRTVLDIPFDRPLIKTVAGFGWALRQD